MIVTLAEPLGAVIVRREPARRRPLLASPPDMNYYSTISDIAVIIFN
jgi:hypothetical protein